MINVVIPVIDNPEEYSKSILSISTDKDVSIIVGVTSELEHSMILPPSIKLKVFKNGSKKEEIINALQSLLSNGKVVVCRRPFTRNEFDKLVSSNAQATYFARKPKSSFVEFFRNILSFMIKFLFGVNFFDGDVSMIAFDADMSSVLQNVGNLSYSTRVDRWRGIEQSTVESERPPVKIESDKAANIRLIIFAILSLLVPVAITVIVAIFAPVTFVIGMILFSICVLGFVGMILILCSLYFNKIVGKRYFEQAQLD